MAENHFINLRWSKMLFLEELNSRNDSWSDLNEKLETCKFTLVIYNNSIVNDKREHILSSEQVEHLKVAFKVADLFIVGMSKGNIIGPLMSFAVDINTHTVSLTEYVAYAHDDSGIVSDDIIKNDLSSLADYLSFFHKDIRHIKMPLIVNSFEDDTCIFEVRDSMCVLTIL